MRKISMLAVSITGLALVAPAYAAPQAASRASADTRSMSGVAGAQLGMTPGASSDARTYVDGTKTSFPINGDTFNDGIHSSYPENGFTVRQPGMNNGEDLGPANDTGN